MVQEFVSSVLMILPLMITLTSINDQGPDWFHLEGNYFFENIHFELHNNVIIRGTWLWSFFAAAIHIIKNNIPWKLIK